MDYSEQIKILEERIEELEEIKDILLKVDEAVCSIEREVSEVDNIIPNPKRITEIKDLEERKQITHAEALLNEAYAIIDEILGPPEEESDGPERGHAISPEAKGNDDSFSLDNILLRMQQGKGKAS